MPFVQAGDLRMHYEEAGAGPATLLLVHGWTGTWRDWQPVFDRVPPGFRAVALDLRGAGETDKPASGYTIEQYAEDVHRAVGALGLTDIVIVGHSMGGTISYQYAITHGDDLRGAVFCAPAGADGMTDWSEEAIDDTRRSRADRDYALASAAASFVRPVPESLIEAGVDGLLAASDGHVYDSVEAMRNARLGGRLGEIRVPSLMIGGDRDPYIPLEMLVADFKRIPGCHLHVFYRAGHSMMAELPDEFAATLFDFVGAQ